MEKQGKANPWDRTRLACRHNDVSAYIVMYRLRKYQHASRVRSQGFISLHAYLNLIGIGRHPSGRQVEGLDAVKIGVASDCLGEARHICTHLANTSKDAGALRRPLDVEALFVAGIITPLQRHRFAGNASGKITGSFQY